MSLMYSPWVIAERIDRPIAQVSHTLVKMPARESNPKLMTNTKCRYCKHNTSFYCQQCSLKGPPGSYVGVCNVSSRMCWAKHMGGDGIPAYRARGNSMKRVRHQ